MSSLSSRLPTDDLLARLLPEETPPPSRTLSINTPATATPPFHDERLLVTPTAPPATPGPTAPSDHGGSPYPAAAVPGDEGDEVAHSAVSVCERRLRTVLTVLTACCAIVAGGLACAVYVAARSDPHQGDGPFISSIDMNSDLSAFGCIAAFGGICMIGAHNLVNLGLRTTIPLLDTPCGDALVAEADSLLASLASLFIVFGMVAIISVGRLLWCDRALLKLGGGRWQQCVLPALLCVACSVPYALLLSALLAYKGAMRNWYDCQAFSEPCVIDPSDTEFYLRLYAGAYTYCGIAAMVGLVPVSFTFFEACLAVCSLQCTARRKVEPGVEGEVPR